MYKNLGTAGFLLGLVSIAGIVHIKGNYHVIKDASNNALVHGLEFCGPLDLVFADL